ncbi:MAG: hypothetical protein WCL39_08475, partial [Armatimonadota bacterium]
IIEGGGRQRKLVNPRFFERYFVAGGSYHDVVCDNFGVYELTYGGTPGVGQAVWQFTSDAYRSVRGVPLKASSAKMLANGRMLITNEFSGIGALGRDFHGEVFEVSHRPPGEAEPVGGILWSAPAIESTGPVITGSYILEQPTYADRR